MGVRGCFCDEFEHETIAEYPDWNRNGSMTMTFRIVFMYPLRACPPFLILRVRDASIKIAAVRYLVRLV